MFRESEPRLQRCNVKVFLWPGQADGPQELAQDSLTGNVVMSSGLVFILKSTKFALRFYSRANKRTKFKKWTKTGV